MFQSENGLGPGAFPSIKQMEDGTRGFLKWLNFLLPIVLVLIYGFIRFQYRKNQRILRMEANYS
jgi:hypothetical protein